MNFNEDDIKFTYDLLGHSEETEIRLIDPNSGKPPTSKFVKSPDEFIRDCRSYNGRFNVYAGINERRPGGTKGKDVLKVNAFIIDIDAKRPDNKLPATEKELKGAEEATRIIFEFMEKEGYFGYSALSGNGYQLWYPLPPLPAREELEKKIQTLQKEFKVRFETPQVDIDNIGDLPRIIKVIGTMNIKGPSTEERPHRLSCWIKKNGKVVKNDKLARFIERIELPESTQKKWYDLPEGEIKKIIQDPKINGLLEGKWQKDYKSRSEAEMGLVCALAARGATKEQIFEVMDTCGIGKWQGKTESYHERTYERALEFISRDEDHTTKKDEDPPRKPPEKNFIIKKVGKDGKIKKTVVPGLLGDFISSYYYFKTLADTHDVYYYSNGVYTSGENLILSDCQKLIGPNLIKTHYVNESLAYIQRKTFTERIEFDKDEDIINLQNGFFNLKTKRISPHTHKYLSLIKLPFSYDKGAPCSLWLKYLEEAVPNDEDRVVLQEVAGYCFESNYDIHKAILLEGRGGNGKSVFLDTITALLGSENVSNISWQDLGSDKYAKAKLFGKMANIHADLPGTAITNTGNFKMLTGGDKVWSDRKFDKQGIEFCNRAKLIFSANQVPQTEDYTDSFFQRIILISFPIKFRDTPKEDKDLKKKLLNELPGIFNWALEGLERLRKKKKFSTSKTTDEFREFFLKKSDTVFAFYEDCITAGDSSDVVAKDILFQDYVEYCRGFLDIEPVHKQIFGRDFARCASHIGQSQRRLPVDDKGMKTIQTTVWTGIAKVSRPATRKVLTPPLLGPKKKEMSRPSIPISLLLIYPESFSPGITNICENVCGKVKNVYNKNTKKGLDSLDTPQKSRLTYLLQQIKDIENKYKSPPHKQELLQEYETRKWTEPMLDKDLRTLMRDGLIYDPNLSERYRVI